MEVTTGGDVAVEEDVQAGRREGDAKGVLFGGVAEQMIEGQPREAKDLNFQTGAGRACLNLAEFGARYF